MRTGKKETLASVISGSAIYIAPAIGHKSKPPNELYGYHEIEEWINYGFSIPVLAANFFVYSLEKMKNIELGYKSKVLIGLGTVAAWKGMQFILRSQFGTEWIESEIPGDYQSVLDFIRSETLRDLMRGIVLSPFTRKGYEILRNRVNEKIKS